MSIFRSRSIVFGSAIAGIAALAAAAYFWAGQRGSAEFSGARESVRIGMVLDIGNTLMIVAQARSFLQQAGLDVETRDYPSGKRSLEGMLAGETDIAIPADVPVVIASFSRQDFRILASVATADNSMKIVARKDRGIQAPGDLKGKRIATQQNSAVHYFLDLFLANYGLSDADAKVSFMKAEALPTALAGGAIDAFSMREPYVSQGRKLLGNQVIVFDAPGLYQKTDVLVVSERFVQTRKEALRRLLQALLRAEEYSQLNPQDARAIVAAKLGLSEAEVAAQWLEFNLTVSLSNAMLSVLQNGARWAIRTRQTDQTAIPDFARLVYADGLRAVAPAAVSLSAK